MKTKKLFDSLNFRLFWMRHGVIFLRSSGFHVKRLKLGKKTITLSIPSGEELVMDYELNEIFCDDCYGLRKIEGQINSILDVGSNLGFFALAARSLFPDAKIHCYEPNPKIQQHLLSNTSGLSIQVHPEAVGDCEGWIDMNPRGGSLHSTTVASEKENIKKTAIANAIEKIGGKVDLLKLDCEGAEWEIFSQREIWKNVDRLTMEYHLWANPKVDFQQMIKIIRDLGFRITYLNESPKLEWGILHAAKV